jgi:hypothetical protein
VPGNPDSGAVYVLDRQKGTWYAVDFEDEQFGGYSVSQHLYFDCCRIKERVSVENDAIFAEDELLPADVPDNLAKQLPNGCMYGYVRDVGDSFLADAE